MASDDYNDFQDMEERLYAQIHHDHNGQNRENDRQMFERRVESHEHVDFRSNPNRGRYWASNEDNYQNRRGFHDKRQSQGTRGKNNQYQQRNQRVLGQDKSSDRSPQQQNQRNRRQPAGFEPRLPEGNRKQFEKRSQSNNFPKKKGPIKGVNPFNVANQEKVRLENKIRIMQKKKKALTRQQQTSSKFKVPELPSTSSRNHPTRSNDKTNEKGKTPRTNTKIVFVDSCSDGETIDITADPVKVEKMSETEYDGDSTQDDDVIMLPTPAPEIIDIIDSDDDSSVQEISNAQKVSSGKKETSSRCVSPSNSSILSDDFIGTNDRTRLRDEFLFVLPEDEDLRGADKNQSTSSDDSNHSNDPSPTKTQPEIPIPGPSAVGNLGEFIVRGEAVESVLNSIDENPCKKQKVSDETNSEFIHYVYQEQSDNDDSDDADVIETQASSIEMTDDVIEVPETQEEATLQRKRNSSEISSECDIVLNISSKNKKSTVNDVEEVVESEPRNDSEMVTIQIDECDEDPERLDPEIGWNDEMRRYYHDSWGGEQFQLRRILTGMTPERKNWQIDVTDRFPPAPVKMKHRCRNCNEFSHKVQNCPQPKRRIVCHMCGEEGHKEPRCPNALCLTCGAAARQFMRYCNRCIENRNKRCTLCSVRGHIFALCPDKWRRYHNTIEDNVPLDETYVPNENMWCSVCASPKHLAHNCLQATRYMGAPLPKIKVSSYLPWYKIDPDAPKIVNSTDFSMMSFAKDFSFNWSSAVKENCTGFYNRFKEVTGIMSEELAKDVDDELESVRRGYRNNEDDSEIEVVPDMDENPTPNADASTEQQINDASTSLNNFSFTKEMEKIDRGFQLNLEKNDQRMEKVDPVVFEDNRKDIAETAERLGVTEEDIMNIRSIKFDIEDDKELDFIPIGDAVEPEPEMNSRVKDLVPLPPEEKTEAKVFLTKEHSKILLNDGESFLHNASQKYDLQLRVVWESVGNMLLMHGLPSKQQIFYNELLDFLRQTSIEEHTKYRNNAFTMPKVRDKLIKFIAEHLIRLKGDKRPLGQLKDFIRKMNHHQQQQQFKVADKFRRQLNAFFLGKNGLREGKTHLIGMIKQYQSLKEDKPGCDSPEFREELRQHFLYLFTAYDHENYEALLNDYEECVQTQSWPIPLKALFNIENMIKMANGQSLDGSEALPSTSRTHERNDSLLFFEDNVGERFEVVSAVGHTDDPMNISDDESIEHSLNEVENDKSPEVIPTEPEVIKTVPVPAPIFTEKTPEKTPKKPNNTKDTPKSSVNYSEASRKIISEAMSMFSLMNNQKAISKLKLVEQKANKNQITEEDYQSLLHIQKIVQSKIASAPT